MTDAEKREKVIRGLECHATKGFVACQDCPYYPDELIYEDDDDMEGTICEEKLAADAIALLKEQEVRVMTLEEIPDYDGAIYLEDFEEPEIVIAVYDRGVSRRMKFAVRGTRSTFVDYDDYNKRWRAWTSRPTEDQRKNTPWETDDA